MSLRTWLATSMTLLATCSFVTGCASDSADESTADSGGEQALSTPQILANDLDLPKALTVVGNHLYFGDGQVASNGRTEHFLMRVPLTGTSVEVVSPPSPGAMSVTRTIGSSVYYNDDSQWACTVKRFDASAPSSTADTVVYEEPLCHAEEGSEVAIGGFEIAGDKLIIIRSNGEILRGGLDGQGIEKIAEVRVGTYRGVVRHHAIAGGALYVSVADGLETPELWLSTVPQGLYRIDLGTGDKTKVVAFDGVVNRTPSHLTTDGTNLFWSTGLGVDGDVGEVHGLFAGASQPKILGTGFKHITGIAANGTSVFVADWQARAIYVIKDVATSPKKKKKLVAAHGPRSMTVAGDTLYYGTQNFEAQAAVIGKVTIGP